MFSDKRIQALFRYCHERERVCLQPGLWHDLWNLLGKPDAAKPLVLSGWSFSTDREKRERFEALITHAIETGKLDEAEQFIKSAKDDEWHTSPAHLLDWSYGDLLVSEREEYEDGVQRGRELYAELRAIDKSEATAPKNIVRLLWLFECLFGSKLREPSAVQGLQQAINHFNECTGDPEFPFFEGEPEPVVQTIIGLNNSLKAILLVHGLLSASGTKDLERLEGFIDDVLTNSDT